MSSHSSHTPNNAPEKSDCLRAHEVANKLGVSREHVLRLLRKGLLPGFKLGRVWLIHRDELRRVLAVLSQAASAQQNTTDHDRIA